MRAAHRIEPRVSEVSLYANSQRAEVHFGIKGPYSLSSTQNVGNKEIKHFKSQASNGGFFTYNDLSFIYKADEVLLANSQKEKILIVAPVTKIPLGLTLGPKVDMYLAKEIIKLATENRLGILTIGLPLLKEEISRQTLQNRFQPRR